MGSLKITDLKLGIEITQKLKKQTRMIKIFKKQVGIEFNSATNVRKQGIRFWDERTF